MTPQQALEAGIAWARQCRWAPELVDYWRTARELEQQMTEGQGEDCDGHGVGAVQRAWTLCPAPKPRLFLVVGDVPGRHLWPQLGPMESALWGEACPGGPDGLMPPSWWARVPLWWYEYDGECFGERGEYVRA